MKSISVTQRFAAFCACVALAGGMLLSGCSKDNAPTQAGVLESAATDDAALSISGAMGDDNGGAANNVGDVMSLASVDGIAAGGLGASLDKTYGEMKTSVIDSSYDPATGWWTVTVTKEKNSASNQYYTKLTRVYRFQFLKNAVAQRYWRVANGGLVDTADVIKFEIVSGTGEYHTPHIHQMLTSLTGSFTATNANTDTITVNSVTPLVRKGVDTLTTANALRTLDHTVTLAFSDIKGPRLRPNSATFTRKNLMKYTTGTVTGSYSAKVTVQRGDAYNERTIDRTFTVTLSGGEGRIGIMGDSRSFKCDLTTGDEKP